MKLRQNKKATGKTALDLANEKLQGWQRKAADFLNHKTESWSATKLKIALVLFCMVMGSASLYVMGYALRNGHGPPSIRIRKLQVPQMPEKDYQKDSIHHKQITNER